MSPTEIWSLKMSPVLQVLLGHSQRKLPCVSSTKTEYNGPSLANLSPGNLPLQVPIIL